MQNKNASHPLNRSTKVVVRGEGEISEKLDFEDGRIKKNSINEKNP